MIYLNNAATSFPKPQEVIVSLNSYLESIPFHSGRVGLEMVKEDMIFSCRQKLAILFNIKDPNRIVFTSGSTESLNLAIRGLELDGGHVITTVIEHNSVLRPLKSLEKEGVIELSFINCDTNGYVRAEDIASKIKRNTRAIVINHCSNVTGELLDLKTISEIAHSHGIVFIVDASQSAGSIPIDISDCNIDILTFTGHKSLFATPGIGGLYIHERIKLKPLKVGGTGVKSELLYQPKEMPMYYEAGTHNLPGIVSLKAGVEFILKTGLERIKSKKEKLFKLLISKLEKIHNIIIYGRRETKNRSPILCINIKGISPSDVGYILENSFGIIVRSGLHCVPSFIRH